MTNQDWEKVKNSWGKSVMHTELKVDGYELSLKLAREKMRLFVILYVNKQWLGKWFNKGDNEEWCDIARKFYQTKTRSFYSAKSIKDLEKQFGKRWCKRKGLYEKYEYKTPVWSSFTAFKKHILEHNKEIELISV